ncbi:MAG TPA: fumarylacetoacetate hydrolase family protein [Lacipirellulaceae bacterium]|nr:fumarylacetoacetate hydrolase family protein [Lacipirellulaceae bacterium]
MSVTTALNPDSRAFYAMKIIRFLDADNHICIGRLLDDGSVRLLNGDLFGALEETDRAAEVKKLLAPLTPSAIFCIGLNYIRHAKEGGLEPPDFPVVFMKSPAAVQHPGEPIHLPRRLPSTEVDFECELAVVIGRTCKNATQDNALDYVLGYTCANDVSARDWQGKWGGGQWCRGKTFDTFAPIGPCLVTADEIPNPNNLPIRTVLNGEVMQDWNTEDMIFNVPRLVEFLSGSTTLPPATLILTGTPHGIGAARKPPIFLKPGDSVTVEIDGIGKLTNSVIEEE